MENKNWQELNFLIPIKETAQTQKDFLIKGIAINATTTRNGHKFVAEELQKSAGTLKNKPLLKDHNNSVESIVGRVTEKVTYDMLNENIYFEAKVMDPLMKEMISDGRITSVSVGAMVNDMTEEKNDETGETVYTAKGINFVELSLVAVPADPDAGFAKAMMESYELKSAKKEEPKEDLKDEDDEDVEYEKAKTEIKEEVKVENKPEEVNKMEEAKVEAPKIEEAKQTVKLGFDVTELDAMIAKLEKVAELKAKIKEEEKVVEKKVEEKVDETKGVVAEKVEEKDEDFVYASSDSGKGVMMYRTKFDEKLSRLRR